MQQTTTHSSFQCLRVFSMVDLKGLYPDLLSRLAIWIWRGQGCCTLVVFFSTSSGVVTFFGLYNKVLGDCSCIDMMCMRVPRVAFCICIICLCSTVMIWALVTRSWAVKRARLFEHSLLMLWKIWTHLKIKTYRHIVHIVLEVFMPRITTRFKTFLIQHSWLNPWFISPIEFWKGIVTRCRVSEHNCRHTHVIVPNHFMIENDLRQCCMDQNAWVNALSPQIVVLLLTVLIHPCLDAPQLTLHNRHVLEGTTTIASISQEEGTATQDIDSMTLLCFNPNSEQIICKDMYIYKGSKPWHTTQAMEPGQRTRKSLFLGIPSGSSSHAISIGASLEQYEAISAFLDTSPNVCNGASQLKPNTIPASMRAQLGSHHIW